MIAPDGPDLRFGVSLREKKKKKKIHAAGSNNR